MAVVAVSLAVPAQADTGSGASVAAQPVELARMRYREGVEAYRATRYRESIDYFLEADRLSPSAALSFNIARAYEKIDDPAAALRWYRDYLRRDPTAKDRAAVESLIHSFEERLSKKGVQQVTVLSEPPGATVVVDGQPVGVTPWTSEIAPGTHQLELRLEGYAPATPPLELLPDHAQDVTSTLVAAVASPTKTSAAVAPNAVNHEGTTASQPRSPPSDGSSTGLPLTTLGWVGIGAGGAALTSALIFELLRRSAETDAKGAHTQVDYAKDLDRMESRQTAARALAGTGAALAIAGGVLLWMGRRKGDTQTTALGAGCVPTACWSTVRGRF
jgi:tetratricopeptide (TPR) repeat protein